MPRYYLPLILAALLLGACSTVPKNISAPAVIPVTVSQAAKKPEQVKGTQVRWGGTIAKVENRQQTTRVEIVARELFDDGEPKKSDRSLGRFMAEIKGFLDPAIYAVGRNFTVVGALAGTVQGKLGEMNYTYPVVEAGSYYLWPIPAEPCETCAPWYYDPWYPWGPYRRYPYY
jgi:outer membrane lipoprotein